MARYWKERLSRTQRCYFCLVAALAVSAAAAQGLGWVLIPHVLLYPVLVLLEWASGLSRIIFAATWILAFPGEGPYWARALGVILPAVLALIQYGVILSPLYFYREDRRWLPWLAAGVALTVGAALIWRYTLAQARIPMEVVEAIALKRNSTPGGGRYTVAGLGLRIRNPADRRVKSLRITYLVKAAERWKGPGSVAPPDWKPVVSWYVRRCYVNQTVAPGGEVCVVCTEDSWIRGVRVVSVEAGCLTFQRPKLSPKEIGDMLAGGLLGSPESPWWFEADVIPELDTEALQAFVVKHDPPEYRPRPGEGRQLHFEFQELAVESAEGIAAPPARPPDPAAEAIDKIKAAQPSEDAK